MSAPGQIAERLADDDVMIIDGGTGTHLQPEGVSAEVILTSMSAASPSRAVAAMH